ncbi:hypothetical protein ACSLBF_02290 [Pseudoalteromonas sp. T1lg65]|uniref:hypothetical protein n=1 Tax=Pseudoalteromonas sp. T1lg65 TaxID=2077101 RepID=UPI003F7AB72C
MWAFINTCKATALYLIFSISFAAQANSLNHFHAVSDKTWFITAANKVKTLQPNQTLVTGERCAMLVGTHADLVATTQLIAEIKQRINTPLCYLVSLHHDATQDVSVALFQRAFPRLKWIAPSSDTSYLEDIQHALTRQLDLFEQSLTLSTARIEKLDETQKLHWQKRLNIANARLQDWRSLPKVELSTLTLSSQMLQLGNLQIKLQPVKGYSGQDFLVFVGNVGLIGGHTLDPIPLITTQENQAWRNTLAAQSSFAGKWIYPGYGKPYQPEQLRIPKTFLWALTHGSAEQAIEITNKLYTDPTQQKTARWHVERLFKKMSLNKN